MGAETQLGRASPAELLGTDNGYTVALCRLPESRYPITRPGGELPFAYAKDRDEVITIIEQDQAKPA